MLDWLTANWLWILVVLGVGWLFLRGGMGCGMGGHGQRHEPAPRAKELEGGERAAAATTSAGSTNGARRHGGCC